MVEYNQFLIQPEDTQGDPQKQEVNTIVADIKASNPIDKVDLIGGETNADPMGNLGSDVIDLSGMDVDIEQTHQELRDGSYTPKFENYVHGVNNEQRLSTQQSGWEQTINGITKGLLKTGLNVVDATVGTVVGLVGGIAEGSASAIYNNDFSNWIDDLNTKMDYALPNYYTNEQKNMGFLKSMTTTNFWANDFLGGMSFMLGTIGSEMIWATATGGASLLTTAPRLALKAGAKGILRTSGKQSAKNFYKSSLKLLKQYNRTIPVSNAGKIFNNARFLYTSAGYEAGVEARHSLNESMENFTSSYERFYGRKPTSVEYADFMDEAVSSSNKVFASNVALVGASNIAQFGSYFGIGTGLTKGMSKSIGKTFGLGITKTLDDSGKILYNNLKPNRARKILGGTANILKAPFTEGFIEEGGQGVITRTSQKWLASQYNPDSLRENYDVIDAATESFQEVYGTKEGFKEVGLGMLIGFFGSAGKRGVTGKRTPFNFGEFSDQVAHNENLAENLNNSATEFTNAQKALLDRLVVTNQFNTYNKLAKEEADKGNLFNSSINWDMAQFSKMLMEDQAGMLDESIYDFKRVIEATPEDSLVQEYGLTSEQAQAYKGAMVENYTRNVDLFQKSSKIAEAMSPSAEGFNFDKQNYTKELSLNIYLGARASERASEIADSIDEVIGTNGIASALRIYTNLSKKAQRRADRLENLETELGTLEQEYARIQLTFTATNLDKEVRTGENQEVAKKLNKTEIKSNKVLQKLQTKRAELEELSGQLENRFFKSDFAFGGNLFRLIGDSRLGSEKSEFVTDEDIKSSVRELQKLDKYRELLKAESPQIAEGVEMLIAEYTKNVKAFRDFNLVYEQMVDPRFARHTYKGVSHLFNNVGTKFNKEDYADTALDIQTEKLNEVLNSNETNLSADQKFTLETLHRMSTAFYLNVKVGDYTSDIETIPNEEYQSFMEDGEVSEGTLDNIASKLQSKETLTPRERDIYDGKKDEINAKVEDLRLQEGDSLSDVLIQGDRDITPADTLVGRLRQIIENVKNSNKYLNEFDVNDFSTDNKPSNKEYEEYEVLFTLFTKGKITPKKQARYNVLKQKINNWGKMEGTLTPDKVLLSDLIEQVSLLETQLIGGGDSILASLTDLNDLVDVQDIKTTNRNNNYDNLQTYDKAMVSKNSDKEYVVSNISLNGFLAILENTTDINVFKNSKPVSRPSKGWNITTIKQGQRYTIEIDTPTEKERLVVKIGSGNNLLMSENTKDTLNSFTSLKVYPSNNLPTNYQPLLRELEQGGETILVPVNSDFSFEGNLKMAIDSVFNLSENESVFLEVSTKDAYNKRLLKVYNDATGEAKENAKKDLEKNLAIYVKDKGNNFIGVHKSTNKGIVSKEDTKFETLQKIRKVAVSRVLDEAFMKEQTIDLGMSIPVSQVYPGHPNFNIVQMEGKTFVKNANFTPEQLTKVSDIGYALNGKLRLKEDSSNIETFPYLTNVLREDRYKGRKVPFIVFDFQGKKMAYPVSLKPIVSDISLKLDAIVESDIALQEKILSLNNLLMEYNIDLDKNGYTFDNYNEEHLAKTKELLKESRDYPNIDNWFDNQRDMESILTQEATINIDISDRPFHSPKVKTKIEAVSGLDSNILVDISVEEELTPDLEEETEKIQKESC